MFSIRRGWVVRPSRGLYEATEKGKKFLKVM
jgi:DNA-binding PadR family transcriptional regulator